jgi:hypothetical protein
MLSKASNSNRDFRAFAPKFMLVVALILFISLGLAGQVSYALSGILAANGVFTIVTGSERSLATFAGAAMLACSFALLAIEAFK